MHDLLIKYECKLLGLGKKNSSLLILSSFVNYCLNCYFLFIKKLISKNGIILCKKFLKLYASKFFLKHLCEQMPKE